MCESEREPERANVDDCEGENVREKEREKESESETIERTSERDLRVCVLLSKDRAIFQNFTRRA